MTKPQSTGISRFHRTTHKSKMFLIPVRLSALTGGPNSRTAISRGTAESGTTPISKPSSSACGRPPAWRRASPSSSRGGRASSSPRASAPASPRRWPGCWRCCGWTRASCWISSRASSKPAPASAGPSSPCCATPTTGPPPTG